MAKDYYDILGVNRDASPEEIKAAFRRLAHQHHPDKTGGNADKFKEINGAYQVLSDAEKRKQYDQFGTTFEHAGAGAGQGGFGGFGPFDFSRAGGGGGAQFDFGDLGDMFEGLGDVFGFAAGGRGRTRARRGQDIAVDIEIALKESVFGVAKRLNLYKSGECKECGGTGAEKGTGTKKCGECNGAGQIVRTERTILGSVQTATPCRICEGTGEVPEKKCRLCNGGGVVKRDMEIEVKIPAGIEDGSRIRLTGHGEAIRRGKAGDLYITVHVAEDARFERRGNDIYGTAHVPFTVAALGGVVKVDTVDGAVDLKIPDGTQSGQVFRIRGKGVPHARDGRGDQYVDVQIEVPKHLSKKAKKLLEELGGELGYF